MTDSLWAKVYALEDLVADYLELKSSTGVVTLDTIRASPGHAYAQVGKLLKLVGLSEGVAADGAFVRQARRKYV
jgi:hypothetical protein